MYDRGSQVERWTGDRDSAPSIVEYLIRLHDRIGKTVLKIQRELVDMKKDLNNTVAGQEVKGSSSRQERHIK
jgi:hypothetical protein